MAGVLIGWLGEWPCFLVNALSYVAVLASLAAMRLGPAPGVNRDQGIVEGLKAGLGYVCSSPPIRSVLALLSLVNLMSIPTTILLPLVAGKVLHGRADTFVLLTSASGLGTLGASLFLAARRSVLGLSVLIAWTSPPSAWG